MMYKDQIPDIANRIKYCVTDEAMIEFFKIELRNAYDNGWQDGFGHGLLQGEIDGLDRQIEDINNKIQTI